MSSVKKIRLDTEEGQLPLTVAYGAGRGAPVVMVPSAFGVAPDVERQLIEMAEHASFAVAMDLFFREDPGFIEYGDMARIKKRFEKFDRDRSRRDLRSVLAWARAEAKGMPLVGLGVCMGGPAVLRAAADGLVAAVVTWHGSAMENYLDRAAEMRCPMRHHFGGADPFVPSQAVDAVKNAFAGRKDVGIIVHEGANHGYSHPDAEVYDARAERAGMASVIEMIHEVSQ